MPDTPTHEPRPWVLVLDVGAFACELALLAGLAVAGAGLGTNLGLRLVLSIGMPLLAVLVWGVWMAPTSSRRLRDPQRFAGQFILFATAGVLMALAGRALWGITLTVVSALTFAAARWGPNP